MLPSDDPVSLWINELRQADPVAARKLWTHFVSRLYELGRNKLQPSTRRVYDEEDVALSAFQSFCAGISDGRFPDLHDRESLWHLLLLLTARKISNRQRHDQQQRRDVHRTLSDSIYTSPNEIPSCFELVNSREPTPEFAAEFVDTCEHLYQSLNDPTLQQVVTLRLEGYTDSDVANRLNCSRRTVQRRLEVIRRHCERLELSSD
ncbi:ECF-type sigma factor [soil metagenome]